MNLQNSILVKGLEVNIPFAESSLLSGDDLHTEADAINITNEADAVTGWTATNVTLTSESSDGGILPNAGSWMFKIIDAGASSSCHKNFTTVVGSVYTVSFSYYLPSAINAGRPASFEVFDLSVDIVSVSLTGEDRWIFKNITFMATTTTSKIELRPGSTTDDVLYIDNLALRELDQTTYDLSDNSEITLNNVHSTVGNKGHGVKWYKFDGVDDVITITDAVAVQNIFDDGGVIFGNIYPNSDGQTDAGRILDKRTGWYLSVASESGGFVKLQFLVDFSTTDGIWILTSADIPINEWTTIAVSYDNSDVANNPVIYINGVSKAVTENTTPVGTRVTDVGSDLIIGNRAAGDRSFDGNMSLILPFNYAVPSDSITSWSAKIADGTFKLPWVDQGADNAALWDAAASVFTSGTYSWAVYGTNTIANVSNTLEITYVDDGSGAGVFLKDADDLASDLTVGKNYRLIFDAKYTGGIAGCKMRVQYDGGGEVATASLTTSLVNYTIDFTATSATADFFRAKDMVASNVITLDNIYLTELGSTLTLDPSGIKDGTWVDYDHSTAYDASDPEFFRNSWDNAWWLNGADSWGKKLDADWTGLGYKVIAGWFNATGWGEGNVGRIVDDSDFIILISEVSEQIQLFRDGGATAKSDANSVILNTWIFFAIVTPADGNGVQFWISNDGNAPTNQTADATAATPTDGTDLYFGNQAAGDRTFSGAMDLAIWDGDKIKMPISDWIQLLWNTTK